MWYEYGMKGTHKFTVSLPEELFEFGEKERHRRQLTRSGFVANLYLEALRARYEERRAAKYAEAYAGCPETEEERQIAEAASALFEQ
jgi:hypothetical protein